MRKIWYLEAINTDLEPWAKTYSTVTTMVVCAEDEAGARQWAKKGAGDEGDDVWLYPAMTTCREMGGDWEEGFVLSDYRDG